MKLLLAVALFLSCEIITAQSVDTLEEKLTNGDHQKWKLTEIDGASESNSCRELTYDFHLSNKRLYRTLCDDKVEDTWIITDDVNDYKKHIRFYKPNSKTIRAEYEIQFVRKNKIVQLRLRSADVGNFRQTTDYYFQAIDD